MTADSREQRVQDVLHAYLQAIDRGETPDRQAILNAHADLRDDLAEYFTDASKLERMAKSLKTATFGVEGGAGTSPALGRVRYVGDYELLEEIARGGMGVVFKARQVSLNRVVALKMILKGELATQADVRRFRQEAEAAGHLDHPNIVPIYEIGEHDGQQYFSMKLIDAQSPKGMDAATGARRLAKVARAVHHAHQHGILHRDLKPSNILIDREGEPHVADFGLAKNVESGDDVTKSGAIVGTPAYMAPEQARAEKTLTTAVDVYSLGAILYEWLTKRPPFRGEDAFATLMKVVSDEPARPSAVEPAVDRDLETICLKCLEKDATRRYGSAEALADDLERWQRHEPILARRATARERFVKWGRRNPAAAMFTAFSAVLLVAFISTLLYFLVRLNRAVDAEAAASKKSRLREEEAEASLKRERRVAYAQRIHLAHREWLADNVSRAEQLLEECPADLRGWEWDYLKRLSNSERFALTQSDRVATELSITRDGRTLLALNSAGEVVWYDARTGNERKRRGLVSDKIGRAAFSPDGALLATTDEGPDIQMWNLDTGVRTATLKGHASRVYHLAFSPDGSQLASVGADDSVFLWDAAKGKESRRLKGHVNRHLQCVVFSPDGKRLVSTSGALLGQGEVKVWDLDRDKAVDLTGHREVVFAAAFSPDGRRIATAGWDQTVRVWDAANAKEIVTARGIPYLISRLTFTPDGASLLVTGQSAVIRILDAATGLETGRVRGHHSNVVAMALAADGQSLATSAGETAKNGRAGAGEIRMWDLALGQECRSEAFAGQSACFNPDGKQLAIVPMLKNHALVVDAATGLLQHRLEGHEGQVTALAYSPNGRRVVTASGSLFTVTVSDDKPAEKRKPAPGHLVVWDTASGEKVRTFVAEEGVIEAIAFRPRHEQFATVGRDRIVRLRSAATGEEIRKFGDGESSKLFSVVFSPDAKTMATWSADRTIQLFDVETGERKMSLRGHRLSLGRIAFSPNGKHLASAAYEPRTVSNFAERQETNVGELKLWDAATGEDVTPFPARMEAIEDLVFSQDGKRLATACSAGTIKLWDTVSGEETLTLRGHSGGATSVAFSEDDRRLVSTSWLPRILLASSGEVKVWDATPVTAAPRSERLAAGVVAGLFSREGLGSTVRKGIEEDDTLEAEVRDAALDIARPLGDDPYRLNDLAWKIVRLPTDTPSEYRRALAMIEIGVKARPDDHNYLNTLGVAQYRAGEYKKALVTLTRSNELAAKEEGSPHPCDVAFLALTCHHLKLNDDAQKHFAHLRELMKKPDFARAEDEQGFLREVEAALPPVEKKKP